MKRYVLFLAIMAVSSISLADDQKCGMYVSGSQSLYSIYEAWIQGYYKALNPKAEYKEIVKFSSGVYDLCQHLTDADQEVSILDAAKALMIMGVDK